MSDEQAILPRSKNGRFTSTKEKRRMDRVIAANTKKKRVNECSYVFNGRRLVELDTLGEQLWCDKCNIPLSLRHATSEIRHCLASDINVRCLQCNTMYEVNTCKPIIRDNKTHYEINGKAAFAIYDCGLGLYKLNDLLSILDVPTFSPKQLKKYEEHASEVINKCATECFEESIAIEKEMTIGANEEVALGTDNIGQSNDSAKESEDFVYIVVAFDAGWQKRGSGYSRNSLSGHACIVGYRSGLVLGIATRSKSCAQCATDKTKNHRCHRNWTGSSKSMEPAMAVELIIDNPLLQKQSVRVGVLIADDDAATISNLRKKAPWYIEKWSDINHTKKNMTSQLYALKCQPQIIKYFARRFMLILKTNQDDPSAIRELFNTAVDHAYGRHEQCGVWCGYVQDPETYTYNNLPGKKPLSDDSRYNALKNIFRGLAEVSDKLAPGGSTQANESFNHTVSVSHPKSSFFASSCSFQARVEVAALKSNKRSGYILQVHEMAGYSPGYFTTKHRLAKDELSSIRRTNLKDPKYRRRRNELKTKRSQHDYAAENREGVSYQSGCSLYDFSSILGELSNETGRMNLQGQDPLFVVFDLETTNLSCDVAEICQIAAASDLDLIFSRNIVPVHGMSRSASSVTGLTVINGRLHHNGQRLESSPEDRVFNDFIVFLEQLSLSRKIILVAHNGFRFDSFILLRYLLKYNLVKRFEAVVAGFSDSLPAARELLPDRKKEKKKYNQSALLEDYVGEDADINAHNAAVDVCNLLKLLKKLDMSQLLLKYMKTTKELLTQRSNAAKRREIEESFDEKIHVSNLMKKRLAAANITLELLLQVYSEDGMPAISFLLSESVDGKPRITKTKKIIDQVLADLERMTATNNNNKCTEDPPNGIICNLNSDVEEDNEAENVLVEDRMLDSVLDDTLLCDDMSLDESDGE